MVNVTTLVTLEKTDRSGMRARFYGKRFVKPCTKRFRGNATDLVDGIIIVILTTQPRPLLAL